jgi:hypothetical protein
VATTATQAVNADVFETTGLTRDQILTLVEVLRDLRRGAGDFEEPA